MNGIRPLKALGQHFLTNLETASEIAHALSEEARKGLVLEIGPGTGVLTNELIEAGVRDLHCVEVDERSVEFMKQRFPELSERIHLADFLQANLDFLGPGSFSVIGNFPYNISSQILFRVLEQKDRVVQVVGMFQNEVGVRVIAGPGKKDYGILSVLLAAWYRMSLICHIPPQAFVPPPKVDSVVINLQRNDRQTLPCNQAVFTQVVKAAFNQRRKMLRNTWADVVPEAIAAQAGIALTARAEEIAPAQFVHVAQMLAS